MTIKEKRKTDISVIKVCCICVGVCLLLVAGYKLFIETSDYTKAQNLYKKANTIYVFNEYNTETEVVSEDIKWEGFTDVDIAGLRMENEDIVGWIYFENEDISYPILYSGDNTTYMQITYTGKSARAGSIFMDEDNSTDFSDAHTIIYGHNMKDLSMFGRLKYYKLDEDYIDGHEYFQIITENKKYRYKIVSYKEVEGNSPVYAIYKTGDDDFVSFVKNILLKGNYINNSDTIKASDHLITLSTCSKDKRFIVSAVRCDECIIY